MTRDEHKSFGEKAARRLEEAAGLPRLWLDTPDADLDVAKGAAMRIGEPPAAWAPPGWPWSAELWKTVQAAAAARYILVQAQPAAQGRAASLGLGARSIGTLALPAGGLGLLRCALALQTRRHLKAAMRAPYCLR